jgi:hypothetical protein
MKNHARMSYHVGAGGHVELLDGLNGLELGSASHDHMGAMRNQTKGGGIPESLIGTSD